MTSGSMTRGKRITLKSDKATNALLAVRTFPVKIKIANVVTATYRVSKIVINSGKKCNVHIYVMYKLLHACFIALMFTV